jgi:hypothetical protein
MIPTGDERGKPSKQRGSSSVGDCRGRGLGREEKWASGSCMGYNTVRFRTPKMLDGDILDAKKSAESRKTDTTQGSSMPWSGRE